ncbi:MAG: hypothetical protein E7633_08335 [Ruminococcaceae bacterium]|nr:hypothetical protein [Oscillospiraceae bacterium]
MDKNYKFDEITPVPVESIRVNPMFVGPDDPDEEKNDSSMPKPEIPIGRESMDYRSDFDSDMGFHKADEDYEIDEDVEDEDYEETSDEDDENIDEGSSDGDSTEAVNIDALAKSGERYAAGYQLIGKKPNDFRARHKGLFKRDGSFIMRFVDKTVAKIYDMTKNGILGSFFTSYDKIDESTESSVIISAPSKLVSVFKKRRRPKIKEKIIYDDITGEEVAKIREKTKKESSIIKKIVSVFEKSVLLSFIERFLSILLYLPMATYGALLLSTGITTILVQSAKSFWLGGTFSTVSLLMGVAYTLVAMITIFAGDVPLVRYLCESKMGSFILVSVFGLFKKNIDTEKKVPKYGFIAFLLGVGLGLLSAVISAFDIFFVIVALVVAIGVAHNPESGVVIISFFLPFASVFINGQKYLYLLIVYVSLAWIIKLLRGQRRAKFGALDGLIIMFAGFVILTALVSVDRTEAIYHAMALVMPIMGYFLVANLFSSRVWLSRGVSAMLISGFVVAAYGIYEWVVYAVNNSWKFDKLLNSNINSVCGTTEMLSVYLMVIVCFALAGLSHKNVGGMRLLSLAVILPVIICILLTIDVYAWMILLISVMFYALIKSKKNAASIFGVLAVILFVLYIVSDILPSYLFALANDTLAGSFDVMHVSIKMIGQYAMTGIGLGETVFENIYASLSQTGAVSASDSGSLFFEVLIRFGVVGIIFLAATVILVYRQAFSTYKVITVKRYASVYSMSALTAFTALLLVSGINYIWKDFSVAYIFWSIVGYVCATRKTALFENAAVSENSGLDIKLPISTFRKKIKKTK